MLIDFANPGIQAAVVQALGGILAALIAALAASAIGRQIAGRKQLQKELRIAVSDIQFLLAVEKAHAALHLENTEESNKQRVRRIATERGEQWSGRFTPGRAITKAILRGENLH